MYLAIAAEGLSIVFICKIHTNRYLSTVAKIALTVYIKLTVKPIFALTKSTALQGF